MTGYAVKLRTVDGVLVLEHGEPGAREVVRLGRSQRKVRHLVLAGRTGYVTLGALRWCEAVGMTVTVLSDEGAPQLVTVGGEWLNGALRRRQAANDGLEVARGLIGRKLEEAVATLRTLAPEPHRERRSGLRGAPATEKVEAYRARLDGVTQLSGVLHLESLAGRAYWRRLAGVMMRWKGPVPEHWHAVGRRHRPWPEADRRNAYVAITPAHALINYGYGYLLAEAVQACYGVGLDPAIGYLHRRASIDQRGGQRAEFAMDLMEPVRPMVDRQVLGLIASRTFTWRDDAIETPSGGIHLSHALRRELILSLVPSVRRSLASEAAAVVRTLRRPNRPTVQLESS